MNYYPDFAELLNQYLMDSDISEAWLARLLKVHRSTVARWLNGETRPSSPVVVIQIADVLGVYDQSKRQQLLLAAGYDYLVTETGSVTESGKFSTRSPSEFGRLLNYAIKTIHAREDKAISIIQEELGYELYYSASTIEKWRKGSSIPSPENIEILARKLVKRGNLDRDWLKRFLWSAGYSALFHELESSLYEDVLVDDTDVANNIDTSSNTTEPVLLQTLYIGPSPFWRLVSFFSRNATDTPSFPPYITIMFEFSYFKLFTTFYESEFSKIVAILGIGSLVIATLRLMGIHHSEGYQLVFILLAVISIFIFKQYLRRYFL